MDLFEFDAFDDPSLTNDTVTDLGRLARQFGCSLTGRTFSSSLAANTINAMNACKAAGIPISKMRTAAAS